MVIKQSNGAKNSNLHVKNIDVPGSDNKNIEIISYLRTYTDVRFVNVFSLFWDKYDRYLSQSSRGILNNEVPLSNDWTIPTKDLRSFTSQGSKY